MGILWVEFYLISAHGLQHLTSLWKRQWYAVGWIDENSKYCTKVDDSGNANPVWRTKFVIPVDDSELNIQNLALNVEVYSIDATFFKEKLHGAATVSLEECLARQVKNSEVSKPRKEEVQSYQLRKKKSNKPSGFIDILIRISEEKEPNSYTGSKEEIVHLDRRGNTQLIAGGGSRHAYQQPQPQPQASIHLQENYEETDVPGSHSVPWSNTIYSEPYVGEPSYHVSAGPSYQAPRTRTPPSPPSPSIVGHIPTFLPIDDGLPPSFTNIPLSREAPCQRVPPGVVMEISAAALAAGAVIFGDDFLSGFDVSAGLGDAPADIETDPSF